MIRTLFLSLLFLIPAAAFAQNTPVEIYSLDRAVKSAMDNSAGIQTAAKDIEIAEERVLEARLRFLPDTGFSATATRYNARRAFALTGAQRSTLLFPSDKDNLFSGQGYVLLSLYEGRRNINTLRLAQTSLKQARSKFEAVKLDIVYRTKKAFYQMLLAQQTIKTVDRVMNAVKNTAQGPSANTWQRLEARALSAQLRALEAESRHDMELARLDFLKALNLELDSDFKIEGELATEPIGIELRKALVWATELRPELQSQTLRAEMDAIGVNLALSRRNPSVFMGFDYELTGQEFPLRQNNWDATVGVRLPFAFDFWTQRNQKIAQQRQAEIKRSELRDLVHLQVRKAHKDLVYWQQEWRMRENENSELAALLEKARGENARPIDILHAASGVIDAGRRHLSAVAEHLLARARLERAVGRALNP
jgi:outer membrane protein TolC